MACTEQVVLGELNGGRWMNIGGLISGSTYSELPVMFDFSDNNGETFARTKPWIIDVSRMGTSGLNRCCQISWTDQYRYRGQVAKVTTASTGTTLLFASINAGDISSLYGATIGDQIRIIGPTGLPVYPSPRIVAVTGTSYTLDAAVTIPSGSTISIGTVANDLSACCDITKMAKLTGHDFKVRNSVVKTYPINFDQSCACEINQKAEFITVADYFQRKRAQIVEKLTSTLFFDFLYGDGVNTVNGLIPRIKEAEDCLATRPNETDKQLTYDFTGCCAAESALDDCIFNQKRINEFNDILSNIYSSAGPGEYIVLMNRKWATALAALEIEEHFFTTFGLGKLPVMYMSDIAGSDLDIYKRMTMKGISISGANFMFHESNRLTTITQHSTEPIFIIFPKNKVGFASVEFDNIEDAISGKVSQNGGKVYLVNNSDNRRKASGVPTCFELNGSYTVATVFKDLLMGGYRYITGLKPKAMCTVTTCATPLNLTVTALNCTRCP